MAALAKRLTSLFLATLVIIGATVPAASAGTHEGDLLASMNAERASSGLPPVVLHADLNDDALMWSQHLFGAGALSHNPNLAAVTTGWDKLGENVGVGPTTESLHASFMASAGHRGNILGDYDSVGIAVVEETPTRLWVTVVFMKSLGQQPVAEPPADQPVPYAKQQPAPASELAVAAVPATTAESVAPEPVPAPAPAPVVAVVRTSGRPVAF